MSRTSTKSKSGSERARVLSTIADLAEDGLAERMRLEAAARAVVAARRWRGFAAKGTPSGPLAAKLLRIADSWDASVTTAVEHVEGLRPSEVDGLIAAARHWAAMVRAAESTDLPRAA
jgi:hypothetical protein